MESTWVSFLCIGVAFYLAGLTTAIILVKAAAGNDRRALCQRIPACIKPAGHTGRCDRQGRPIQ